MTSRLDRLFILLESGSSSLTRRAAAKQIGEVQKLYPHELHALLNRLIGYLHSSSWDTRIAAAQSVEAILANVPQWRPELYLNAGIAKREIKKEEAPVHVADEENSCQSNDSNATTNTTASTVASEHNKDRYLTISEFNLEQVLKKGARLIGSEGVEFDINDDTSVTAIDANKETATERLSRQRALLNEKLGLTQASKLGVNLTDMIVDEDVMRNSNNYNINEEKVPVEHILNIKPNVNLIPSNGQQLSCREMNRAKRKARQNAAVSSGNNVNIHSANGKNDEPEKKKLKSGESQRQEVFYSLNDPVPDATGMWIDAFNWPLENFCARLYVDLFHAKWEIRHGAATALRELINQHASGAGKGLNMTREEMQIYHSMWLEDAALRLLCVLCLDRFGDFVSDQVVAPVRETCAQVLGTIVKEMEPTKVFEIVRILRTLLKQNEWEVRHGGLLGLKYVFVVQEKLLPTYLPQTISDILMGLFDGVDDVGAVAASTLIPVASWLPQLLSPTQVSSIVKMLWDLLLDQDELTSASNSFMGLLAAILCLPNASSWIQMEPMSTLVPRLWPFLSHSTSSVRKSTLITLQTLTINNSVKKESSITPIAKTDAMTEADFNFDSKNLKLNFGVIDWQWKLVQDALRHIYQRILVEPLADIQESAKNVWLNIIESADLGALLHAACPYVSSWICLAMQPSRLPFDPAILIQTVSTDCNSSGNQDSSPAQRRRQQRFADDLGGANSPVMLKLYLGGSESTPQEVREQNYVRTRITAARVLGSLSRYLVQPAPGVVYTSDSESPMECYVKVLLGHLNSRSSVQRIVCSLIIAFWAQNDCTVCPGPQKLQEKLLSCVAECVYYDEVAINFTRLLQEAHDLIATFKQYKIPVNDFGQAKVLTLDQIEALSTTFTADLRKHQVKPKVLELLEDRRKGLQHSLQQTCAEQTAYNISTQAALAGSVVCLKSLPEKLNPIVKPLMESIKREDCQLLQELSAEFLVELMAQICDRNPSPNSKIFNNLCTLLKSDNEFTPLILSPVLTLKQTSYVSSSAQNIQCIYYGILSLSLQPSTYTITGSDGSSLAINTSNMPRGPGRPPLCETQAGAVGNAITAENSSNSLNETESKYGRIQRLGSASAISKLCKHFGAQLMRKMPIFEELMFARINQYVTAFPDMDMLQDVKIDVIQCNNLTTSLQLIETAAPHMHKDFHTVLFQMLDRLGILIAHPLKAIRHMTARCIATLADIDSCQTMDFVVNHLLLLLRKIEKVIDRQGGIEAIARVVEKLQIKIVPYIVLLVVPLLGCMSDSDECVRLLSTHCFATLIQLMPLDSKTNSSGGIIEHKIKSAELQARKTRDREFLDYLFTPKSIPDYKVPVPISVDLRPYQQAGVNWLWFLNKYNLHGILCDDMGLGKTLQTICIMAGDHHQRRVDNVSDLPSLVICPPSLTGHWVYEVEKFLQNSDILRPMQYVGLPSGRELLRCLIGKSFNFVVASYDTIRKDIEFFNTIHWNYCVLDEGHIIKNGKTKSSKAIKMLKANHRLILSGTPIQNNVLELWSLFDFLMPGFLGTEKQFITRYSRPILGSRDAKSSPKEQEAGVLAMEALHRQVLPFLLRRVKEDVLTDLPPKITQDLLCDLSPLQERLYEDFSRSHLNSELKDCLENLGEKSELSSKTHIFHALRYLQNVCNHPKLILTPKHPEYERINQELVKNESSLSDIEHSAKLPALKQLLLDCGIGVQTESVSQHRALIFCQLKTMLDIVEKDLLRKHLPTVTYLRLDGSVVASMRQDIVHKFNTDPSIDVLLLTTQVGGLGLNLTGADTVIFVEHDWNPMKDLQAMDRAHRIGQKKVVNVYRLITRKSLEEKIMGLQKFKILTANTVVSSENANLETMATGQIFDLFNLNESSNKNGSGRPSSSSGAISSTGQLTMNSVLENLPELWSEQQYDEEYDISNFVQSLKK